MQFPENLCYDLFIHQVNTIILPIVIIIMMLVIVQQGSFYGLAGMLPPRFTQALMLGESIAGFAVSVLRIVTKVAAKSESEGAIAFFAIGLVYIILCVVGQAFIYRSKFVKYYINQSKISSRQVSSL